MFSFLCLSSQVLVHIVSIRSFLMLVCREWMWNSWTRTIRFHHGLVFPSLIFFFVLLRSSMYISALGPFSSPSSIVILFIHSVFSLCYFGCHIFVQNRSFFCARLVIGFLCHALPVVDRNFFRCPVIIIIIIYSLEFYISSLADGLSLEFVWQQVSSSLQDSSQFSGRSQ